MTDRRATGIDFDPAHLFDHLDSPLESCSLVQMSLIDIESAAVLRSEGRNQIWKVSPGTFPDRRISGSAAWFWGE